MTEYIASKIGYKLVKNSIIKTEEQPVLEYGLFLIISDVVQVTILIVTGLLLGNLLYVLVFSLFFTTLKRYVGGAHAKTHRGCIFFFTLLAHVSTTLCRMLPNIAGLLTISMLLITFTIVINLAPKCHPHNPKPMYIQKKLRRTAIIIAAIQSIICSVGVATQRHSIYFLCASCGSFFAAASLLIPTERRCDHEKNNE